MKFALNLTLVKGWLGSNHSVMVAETQGPCACSEANPLKEFKRDR